MISINGNNGKNIEKKDHKNIFDNQMNTLNQYLYEKIKQLEEEAKTYLIQEKIHKAIEKYQEITSIEKDNIKVLKKLTKCYFLIGNLDLVLQNINNIEKIEQNLTQKFFINTSEVLNIKYLFENDKIDESIKLAEKINQKIPNFTYHENSNENSNENTNENYNENTNEIFIEKNQSELIDEFKDIFSAIEARKSRDLYYAKTYPSYNKFSEFLEWIKIEGSYFPKFDLKFFSDFHRGIFAKNKIYVSYIKKNFVDIN